MARKFLTPIDLAKNEIQNAVVQNIPGTTGPATPLKGQLYFDSTGNILYWYNGSGWVAAQGGAGAVPATTVTTSAVADSAVVGVATTYAREDHKHAREAFGSISASTTFGQATANGSAVTLARSDHLHGTPALPALNALTATADVALSGFKITGLGTPTAAGDATTKGYVDNFIAGLSWKTEAVRAATTVAGTLASSFENADVIDGVTLATGDRILLKNQASNIENGIYTVNASGAPTRATDADAVGELEQAALFVREGTAQADTAWVCTTNGAITPGTTGNDWAQFGAGTAYTAGAGLSLATNTFNVGATNGSIIVAADDIGVGYAGSGTTYGTAVTAARSDHNHDSSTGYTKLFAADCAAATTTTVTHNFNTRDVIVTVYQNSSTYDEVDADIKHTTVNAVDVTFATAPAAAAYRIVCQGIDL